MTRVELQGMTVEELKTFMKEKGYPAYQGEQIFQWLHGKGVQSFAEMTNLAQNTRNNLSEYLAIELLKIEKVLSAQDGTKKLLYSTRETGHYIETVLLYHSQRISLCVSTQVGCRFNCSLCATGKMGFKRNLSVAEIVGQVILAQNYLGRTSKDPQIRNIVFMGMGEPLDNFPHVLKSIEILNHPLGMNIGSRRITISTCGLVPKIVDLATCNLQSVLAVSLHAPTNDLRDILVPINKVYPLEELLNACKIYFSANHRRISFEYALIDNINDHIGDAKNLIRLLKGFPAHINLIPLNPIKGADYKPSSPERIKAFMNKIMEDSSIAVSLRESKGMDIMASCGQLCPLGEDDI